MMRNGMPFCKLEMSVIIPRGPQNHLLPRTPDIYATHVALALALRDCPEGCVATPTPPPEPTNLESSLARLRMTAEDTGATICLCDKNVSLLRSTHLLKPSGHSKWPLGIRTWLPTPTITKGAAWEGEEDVLMRDRQPALLQFDYSRNNYREMSYADLWNYTSGLSLPRLSSDSVIVLSTLSP